MTDQRVIVVSSGHQALPKIKQGPLWDQGAEGIDPKTNKIMREAQMALKFRDSLAKFLRDKGFRVIQVADDLTLRETLKVVNQWPHELAIEIHLNASDNPKASGVEAFYSQGDDIGRQVAQRFTERFSRVMGIPDRGAKTDIESSRKRLGWTREITRGILVELGFINGSLKDRLMIVNGISPGRFGEIMGMTIMEILGS